MKADLSPTARALRALELLQAEPGITAGQLAVQLHVTERAARRYVAILREAGIPVESTRGPYGGYRVGRGIRLPPLVFSAAEALGLVMAVLDGSHAAADADDPVGAALGKIIRALPDNVSRQAAAMRRHACAAPDRGAVRPGTETTSALVAAIAAQRRVSISYGSQSGRQWEEDVDPWAVVVRHGRWYLLCRSYPAQVRRAYRIDRIREVEVLDDTFRPPADLDPVATLEEHLAVGWEYEVEVLVDAPAEVVARRLPRTAGRVEPVDAGTCRLVGSTSNPVWYAEQLAVVPAPYRVVRSPEIRAAVRALGLRLLAAAGEPDP